MRRRSPWLMPALLLCAAILIVSAVPFSLAYITAHSNALRNTFRVEYLPPQDLIVPVTIHKTMIGMGGAQMDPSGFAFRLADADTGETAEETSSEDGKAVIELRFTAQDVGKTRRYRLCELNTGRGNVIYDDTVYEITITPGLNEIHELSAALALDGRPVEQITAAYENRYNASAVLPDSGDDAQPALWLAALALSGAGLMALRRKKPACRRP